MKIIFLTSTDASVIKRVFNSGFLMKDEIEIVSDRECGAIDFAREQKIDHSLLESKTGFEFSEKLCNRYNDINDILFVSFYTKFLSGKLLEIFSNRIINFHPSILPACPGKNGFEDTLRSGSKFIGSTVHIVNSGMDTGSPLIQAAFPRDPNISVKILRHRVFLQQCISLVQITRWSRGIKISALLPHFSIEGLKYEQEEFSPNLDQDLKELYFYWIKL